MPRIEDYRNAAQMVREELIKKNPKRLASMCGAIFYGESADNISLELPFLNKDITISWPELKAYYKGSGEELSLQEQVLILHYIKGCLNRAEITQQWVSYQDIPDGRFYMDAFIRRAKMPMLKTFGERPELLVRLANELYNATPFDQGDFSVRFNPLPYIAVVLLIWEGDEEFPPDGNILFDKGISRILSAEDIAWLAGMIIYPLIGKAKEIVK